MSGTDDFEGARGVFVMADTPTKQGVKTAYIGNLTLDGGAHFGSARSGC